MATKTSVIVQCENGVESVQESMHAADKWCEWGHVCTRSHAIVGEQAPMVGPDALLANCKHCKLAIAKEPPHPWLHLVANRLSSRWCLGTPHTQASPQ